MIAINKFLFTEGRVEATVVITNDYKHDLAQFGEIMDENLYYPSQCLWQIVSAGLWTSHLASQISKVKKSKEK